MVDGRKVRDIVVGKGMSHVSPVAVLFALYMLNGDMHWIRQTGSDVTEVKR